MEEQNIPIDTARYYFVKNVTKTVDAFAVVYATPQRLVRIIHTIVIMEQRRLRMEKSEKSLTLMNQVMIKMRVKVRIT